MSRFIQQPTTSKPAKEKKPPTKFGGVGGQKDYSKLADVKKIPTQEGYK